MAQDHIVQLSIEEMQKMQQEIEVAKQEMIQYRTNELRINVEQRCFALQTVLHMRSHDVTNINCDVVIEEARAILHFIQNG